MKNNKTLQQSDISRLLEAIKQYRGREGSFSNSDPLPTISKKLTDTVPPLLIAEFDQLEINLLLKVINENISYLLKYSYGKIGLSDKFAKTRKKELISDLNIIKNKLANEATSPPPSDNTQYKPFSI